MAFEKHMYYDLKILFLMLIGLPLIASTNIDCGGKSFHCLNSTHFMICVDLGGGVSTTVDDFVIPCPPPTVCLRSNRFECEFPVRTTPAPTVLPLELTNEPEVITEAWESIAVTTVLPTTEVEQHLELHTVNITQDLTDTTVIPLDTVVNTTEISPDTNTVTILGNLLNETTAGNTAVGDIGTAVTVEPVPPETYGLTTENTLTSDVFIIPLETYNINRTKKSNITTDYVTESNIVTTTEFIITNTPSTDADLLNSYIEGGQLLEIKENETIGIDKADTTVITVLPTIDDFTSVIERVVEIVSTKSEGAVLSEVTTEAVSLLNNLISSDSTVSVTNNNTVDRPEPTFIDATTIISDTVLENTKFVDTLKIDTESLNVTSKSEVSVETVPSATTSSSALNTDSIVYTTSTLIDAATDKPSEPEVSAEFALSSTVSSTVSKVSITEASAGTGHNNGISKNDSEPLSLPPKPDRSAESILSSTVSSSVSDVNKSRVDNIVFITAASAGAGFNNGVSKNDSDSPSLSPKPDLGLKVKPSESYVTAEPKLSSTISSTVSNVNESTVNDIVSITEVSAGAGFNNEISKNDSDSLSLSPKPDLGIKVKPSEFEVSAEPTLSSTVSSTASNVNEPTVDTIVSITEAYASAGFDNEISKNDSEPLILSPQPDLDLKVTPSDSILQTETLINESNIDGIESTTVKYVGAAVDYETLTVGTESLSTSLQPEGSVETIPSATTLLNTSSLNESDIGNLESASEATVDDASLISTSTIPVTNTAPLSTTETIITPIYGVVTETAEYLTISPINETVDVPKVEHTVALTTISDADVNVINNNTDTITILPEQLRPISTNHVSTEEIVSHSTERLELVDEINNSSTIEPENITPSIEITTVTGKETVFTVAVTSVTTPIDSSTSELPTTDLGEIILPEIAVVTESTVYITTISDTNKVVIETGTEAVTVESTHTTGLTEGFSNNDINNNITESAPDNLTTERGTDTLSTPTTTFVLELTKPNVFIDKQVSQNNISDITTTTVRDQEIIEMKVQENTLSVDSDNQISNQTQNNEVNEFITKPSTIGLSIESITDNIQISTDNPIVDTTLAESNTIASDFTNWHSTLPELAYETSSTSSPSTVSEINEAGQVQTTSSSDTFLVLGVSQNKEAIVENTGINSQIHQESIGTGEPNAAVTNYIKEDLQAETPLVTARVSNHVTVTETVTKADKTVTASVAQTLETVSTAKSDNVITTDSYDAYNLKSDDVSTFTTEKILERTQPVSDGITSVDKDATNLLENVLSTGTTSTELPVPTKIYEIEESERITNQSTLSPVIDIVVPLETISTDEASPTVTTEIYVISTQSPLNIDDTTLLEGDGTNVNNTNKSTSSSINVKNEINALENILLNGTSSVKKEGNLLTDVSSSNVTDFNTLNNEANFSESIVINGSVVSTSKGSSLDSLIVGNSESNPLENVLLNTTASDTSFKGSSTSEIPDSSVLAENGGNNSNISELHNVIPENQEVTPLKNHLLNGTSTVISKGLSAVNENGILTKTNVSNPLENLLLNRTNAGSTSIAKLVSANETNPLENLLLNGTNEGNVSVSKFLTANESNPLENLLLNGTNAGSTSILNLVSANDSYLLENLLLNGTNSISVPKLPTVNDNEFNPLESLLLNKTIETSFNAPQSTNNDEISLSKIAENPLKNTILNETNPEGTTLLNVNESALPESEVLGSTIVSVSDGVVTIQYSSTDAVSAVDHITATEQTLAVNTSIEPITTSQGFNVMQTASISNDKNTDTIRTEVISGSNDPQSTESDANTIHGQGKADNPNTDSSSLNNQVSTLYTQESIYTTTPKIIIEQTENVESFTTTVKSTALLPSAYPTTIRQNALSPNSELNNSQSIGSISETAIVNNLKEINLPGEFFIDVDLRTDKLNPLVSTTTSVYDKQSEGYLTPTAEVINETAKQTSTSQITNEKSNVEVSKINTEQIVVPDEHKNAPITVALTTTTVSPLSTTARNASEVQINTLESHSTTSPVQTQVTSKNPAKNTIVNKSSSINVNTDKVTDSLPSNSKVNNVGSVTTSLNNTMTKLSDNDQQISHTVVSNIFTNDDKVTEEQMQPVFNDTLSLTQKETKKGSIKTSPYIEDSTMKLAITLPVEAASDINTRTTAKSHVELERKTVTRVVTENSSMKPTTSITSSSQETSTITPVFNCQSRPTGRYADKDDCRKFYICSGITRPITGLCPANTVFSEIRKQCTKNLSHCIRRNEFKCVSPGRFSDYSRQNIYYICVQKDHTFLRYKMQCQNGYHLNRATVRCYKIPEVSNQAISVDKSQSTSDKNKSEKHHGRSEKNQSTNEKNQSVSDKNHSTSEKSQSTSEKKSKEKHKTESHKKSKSKSEIDFECEEEGKFPHPDNCRKYYVCSKSNRSKEFRRKYKKCDSDEVFNKKKKKCVDEDSYECS